MTDSNLQLNDKVIPIKAQSQVIFKDIIGHGTAMRKIFSIVEKVAKSDTTIMLNGETGTGKGLIARAIHKASGRSDQPFVQINCGATPEGLLESEFFGYRRGAFTGATADKAGKFEIAQGGTIFLDEIGDMSADLQVKVLRVLEEGEFERVGGSETIKVDVRVLTATNQNLEDMIKGKLFREDLFYRINVVTITIPPLRERKTDIPILLRFFIEKYSKDNNKEINGISKEAQDYLMRYNFPGNVRELENIIERAVVMTREPMITTTDLPPGLSTSTERAILDPFDLTDSYTDKVAAFEIIMIDKALELKKGNQSQAAKMLGISERHLRSRMQKLNIVNNKRN